MTDDAEHGEYMRKLRAFMAAVEPRISDAAVRMGKTVRDSQDATTLLFKKFGDRPEVVTRTDIENAFRSI